MKPVTIEEISSPGCSHCKAFEDYWHSIEKNHPNVAYKNISILTPEGQEMAGKYGIFAAPGIIINNELFASGGFDKIKLDKKIKELSA